MERSISAVTGSRSVPRERGGSGPQHPAQANCPFCPSPKGFVRRVSITGDQLTLTFVCADCKRNWDIAPVTIKTEFDPFAFVYPAE